ncbi:MAG: hypothetical protein U0325_23965 [Polyangiales bacterium]
MQTRGVPLIVTLLAQCGPAQPPASDAAVVDAPTIVDAPVDAAGDAPAAVPQPLDGRVFLQQTADGWRLRVAFRQTNPASPLRCTVERASGCWFQDCARDRAFLLLDATSPVSVGVFSVTGGTTTARATPEASGYYPPAFGMGMLWTPGTTALTLRAAGVDGARAFETRLTTARPLVGGSAQATRGADFVFRWDAAGAQPGEEVGVRGEVTVATSGDTDRNVEFVCFAPRTAGTLTVPAAMVNRLPAGTVTAQGALYAVAHEDRMVEGYPTLLEVADTPSAVAFTF